MIRNGIEKRIVAACAAALFAVLFAGSALAATIDTVSPGNVTINLFDYWVTAGRDDWDSNLDVGHLETGINKGHAFKFGGSGTALKKNSTDSQGNPVSTVVPWSNAGYWNKGTGFGFALLDSEAEANAYITAADLGTKYTVPGSAYKVQVSGGKWLVNRGLFLENTLGEDGYPKLNLGRVFADNVKYLKGEAVNPDPAGIAGAKLNATGEGQYGPAYGWNSNWDTESLAYLFNPATPHEGKASFANVEDLLKTTPDGYYRFSSYENFAEYDAANNRFNVYADKGIKASGSSPDGQFYPFNTAEDVLTEDERYNPAVVSKGDNTGGKQVEINHFVGMTLEVPFQQPTNGQIGFGSDNQPMVFKFSGDDDTLIYIDGVLVADLSGCHDAITVHIDFSTGEIKQFFSPNLTTISEHLPEGHEDKKIDPENPLATWEYETVKVGDVEKVVFENGEPQTKTVNYNTSNLRAQFEAAGKGNATLWRGNTFASGTVHTLKMFYLERGHTDSNLTLEFNLVQAAESALHKHNQDGDSMAGTDAELTLYKVNANINDVLGKIQNGRFDPDDLTAIKPYNKEVSANISSGMGLAWQLDDFRKLLSENKDTNNQPIGDGYFVLKETHTPEGYRPVRDVLLYYDQDGAGLLHVKNQWTTGARSSFRENSYTIDNNLYYYDYDLNDGVHTQKVNGPRNGLAIAVPLMKTDDGWSALYGNRIWGYDAVSAYSEGADQRHNELMAVLDAALHQIYYTEYGDNDYQTYGEKWVLSYETATSRYESVLKNLPGDVNQYEWVYSTPEEKQEKARMAVLYYYFDVDALGELGIDELLVDAVDEKWQSIADHIDAQITGTKTVAAVDAAIKKLVISLIGKGNQTERFHRLNRVNFETVYTPDIFVPNIVNELRVYKLDHTMSERTNSIQTLEGAEFTLYTDSECQAVYASGTTDKTGLLIFSAEEEGNKAGSAKAALVNGSTYYLRETGGNNGMVVFGEAVYAINDSVVEIKVTEDGVFANATAVGRAKGDKDGIGVWLGVGKVVETMAMYAADGSINDSLTEISAQLKTEGNETTSADVIGHTKLELTYDEEKAFLQYRPIEADGGSHFTLYDGFGYAHVSQLGRKNPSLDSVTDLSAYDINPLFTGSTSVMVANHRLTDKYRFSGSKTLIGKELLDGEFQFDLYKADEKYNKETFVERVNNTMLGTFEFGYENIVDKKTSPQDFYYIVEEYEGDQPGVTYDKNRYGIHVHAEGVGLENEEYKGFKIQTSYVRIDENGKQVQVDDAEPVAFVNTFEPLPLPTTGDDSRQMLWTTLLVLCSAAVFVLNRRRVRQ